MVTDRGQAELEKPVEAMLSFIEFLLANGVSEKDIINMTRNVPESILNQ
jgi:predicted metal-dependent phosphotriesterase family hydrolase